MHPGIMTTASVKGLVGELVLNPVLGKAFVSLSSRKQYELIWGWEEIIATAFGDWCQCEPERPELKIVPFKAPEIYPLEPMESAEDEPEPEGA